MEEGKSTGEISDGVDLSSHPSWCLRLDSSSQDLYHLGVSDTRMLEGDVVSSVQ